MKIIVLILFGVIGFFSLANYITRKNPRVMTKKQVAKEIEAFLNKSGGAYDWDDFLTFRIADPELDSIRKRCSEIDWTTEAGRQKLKKELSEISY